MPPGTPEKPPENPSVTTDPTIKKVGRLTLFTRTCEQCGISFTRSRKALGAGKFCSAFCAHIANRGKKQTPEWIARRIQKGEKHWNYRGAEVSPQGGRTRARKLFPSIGPCEVCGNPKSERHHVNGNPADNSPDNVQALCRRCHNEAEGSVRNLKLRTLQALREQLRAPLPEEAITPIASKPGLYGVQAAYVIQRLNDCFGEDGWEAIYTVIEQGPMVVTRCDLVMRYGKRTITRHAFGGNANQDRGDAYKGSCTDSLTKAASMVGIAESVYMGLHNKQGLHPQTPVAVSGEDYDPVYEERILGQRLITSGQIREFLRAVAKTKKSDDEVNRFFREELRITSVAQMQRSEFQKAIEWAGKVPDDLTETWQSEVDKAKSGKSVQ